MCLDTRISTYRQCCGEACKFDSNGSRIDCNGSRTDCTVVRVDISNLLIDLVIDEYYKNTGESTEVTPIWEGGYRVAETGKTLVTKTGKTLVTRSWMSCGIILVVAPDCTTTFTDDGPATLGDIITLLIA